MGKQNLQATVKLEILISTMNKTSLAFLDNMFPHHKLEKLNILIINQTEIGKELFSELPNIRVVNSYQKGLSLSRNLAIENAFGDICLIADDDIEYYANFETTVKDAFAKFKDASFVLFKIETFKGESYKTYHIVSRRLSKTKDIKSSSSIEMAFKRKPILSNTIKFNPNFGLGSYFPSCEEYLFLRDALKKNLPIYFENLAIVKHKFERSTSDFTKNDFVKTQAVIYYIDYNIFGYLALLKFLIFLVRKQLIPLKAFINKYKIGCKGIKSYKMLKDAKL